MTTANTRPEPDTQTCHSCGHPLTAHNDDGTCSGWIGVMLHRCDPDALPVPGSDADRRRLGLLDRTLTDMAPAYPDEIGKLEQVMSESATNIADTFGDPDDMIDVGDAVREQAARAMRTPLDPAAFGLDPGDVAPSTVTSADLTRFSPRIPDTIDPDDQATHPARNAHDLTVAASTLRGAALLAREQHVGHVGDGVPEWLEQLAQQFDTERDRLPHDPEATR